MGNFCTHLIECDIFIYSNVVVQHFIFLLVRFSFIPLRFFLSFLFGLTHASCSPPVPGEPQDVAVGLITQDTIQLLWNNPVENFLCLDKYVI